MNTNSPTQWHEGGTRTPSRYKQSGPRAVFWFGDPVSLVPQRATEGARHDGKPHVRRGFKRFPRPSGTNWHGGPHQSVRDLGRTR